ncbi:hypothetical protein C0431_12825 [bacterium]|nr:hypothetical protein [bacterium]
MYQSYYACRHHYPLSNIEEYKILEHENCYELQLKLYVLGETPDEIHLLTEAKTNEFFGDYRMGTKATSMEIHGIKRLYSGKAYDHNKDNIDVTFVVESGDMLLFEVELEEEIVSTEGNETSTIRIDINKQTLAHGLYTTFSEDYDIGDDINPETASIDVEEIVPYLVTHRHQFTDMSEEYRMSYALRGEAI